MTDFLGKPIELGLTNSQMLERINQAFIDLYDLKLNRPLNMPDDGEVVVCGSGITTTVPLSIGLSENSIVRRSENNTFQVATPQDDLDASNKAYVDAEILRLEAKNAELEDEIEELKQKLDELLASRS